MAAAGEWRAGAGGERAAGAPGLREGILVSHRERCATAPVAGGGLGSGWAGRVRGGVPAPLLLAAGASGRPMARRSYACCARGDLHPLADAGSGFRRRALRGPRLSLPDLKTPVNLNSGSQGTMQAACTHTPAARAPGAQRAAGAFRCASERCLVLGGGRLTPCRRRLAPRPGHQHSSRPLLQAHRPGAPRPEQPGARPAAAAGDRAPRAGGSGGLRRRRQRRPEARLLARPAPASPACLCHCCRLPARCAASWRRPRRRRRRP